MTTVRRGRRWGLLAYAASLVALSTLLGLRVRDLPPVRAESTSTVPRLLSAAPVLPGRLGPKESDRAEAVVGAPAANQGRAGAAALAFRPTRVTLPGGVSAPVVASGLHDDGSLVIPDDPGTVGWWTGGAQAGDPYGSLVLAGHVDSARYGLGAMAQLKVMRVGQVVQLQAGDRRLRYRVVARDEVPQAELAARTDAFRQDVAHRLVLITCGGAFDPRRHRYQDNILLYAVPDATGDTAPVG